MPSSEPRASRSSPAARGGPVPIGRRVLITLAAGLAGLLLCELAVRWGGLGSVPSPIYAGDNFRDVDDAVQRFENRPGTECTLTLVDSPGAPPRVVRARINQDGFRGPAIPRARTEGRARLACVGDSHTFGYGVGDDEPWPAALSRALERELGPGRVEVLNAGVNGYDAEQELRWLERTVLDWQPDLVVWQYFLNDVAMRGMGLRESQKPGWVLRLVQPDRRGFIGALRRVSRAADLVADRLYRRLAFDLYGSARDELHGEGEPAWQRVEAALLQARRRCDERGVRFAMVLFPYLHRRGGQFVGHRSHGHVAAFCQREGIEVLDLEPSFEGLDPSQLRVHPLEYHANARAHAIAGERVARWLVERRLL